MKNICLFENVLVDGMRYGAGKHELADDQADRIIDAGLGVLIVADPEPAIVEEVATAETQIEKAPEQLQEREEAPAEAKTTPKAKKTIAPKAVKAKTQKADAMEEAFDPIPEAEAE